MRFQVDEDTFFKMGLLQCNHPLFRINGTCKATNMARFKDAYYACPKTVYDVFCDIQKEEMVGIKRIKKPKLMYTLLAFRFLKKYPTAHELAGYSGRVEKTALNQCWKYVEAIQALKPKKVRSNRKATLFLPLSSLFAGSL